MCFELDSAPPIPTIAGAAISHTDLVLEAADGNRLAGFLASPDRPAGVGMVVFPDVRGLYHFYEELALRFAERGIASLAFDYFGRTAGVEKRGEEFDWMPHVQQTTDDGVQADAHAAVDRLRAEGCGTIFTVGFCFGGRASWIAAASNHGLAGAIGFYGHPTRQGMGADAGSSAADRAAAMTCPVLALQAGIDENITPEANAAFERALADAGVEHELLTYEGSPHSFFDRKYEEHADASADAWRRTLAFVEAHSDWRERS